MAQFQIKDWDDDEHWLAKSVAHAKGQTLYGFVVEAIREKVRRECPPGLIAALKKLRDKGKPS